ncbi:hypothetical protein EYF80_005547 [Liparis tanakae]|uniref:Uncharacterized protein n=1 Tax=Liparis tanakae TaxID=230148 RepID=A0A4Z2J1X2_9TELE|nr:hypothetical protein EYF80_005547 [Liparis tanakae]
MADKIHSEEETTQQLNRRMRMKGEGSEMAARIRAAVTPTLRKYTYLILRNQSWVLSLEENGSAAPRLPVTYLSFASAALSRCRLFLNQLLTCVVDAPGLLLEAVAGLLAVPYRAGQREFPPHPVLPHRSERPAAQLLRLHVVRLQPQLLELRVVVRRKLVAFQNLVKLSEVPPMKGHHRLGFEDAFVLVEVIAGG